MCPGRTVPPNVLAPVVTAGSACAGTAFHGLPIPGLSLSAGACPSAQAFILCQGCPSDGNGLTDAVCDRF